MTLTSIIALAVAFLSLAGPALSSPQLYFVGENNSNIFRMSVTGGPYVPVVGNAQFGEPWAVTYDPDRRYIYWSDRSPRGIGQVHLTSNVTTYFETGFTSYGMAADPTTGHVFVTDYDGSIKVLDFNSRAWKKIISGLGHPRGIVVDSEKGWLYWTDDGSDTIEKATMAGSNRTALVTTGLDLPSGLALDSPGGRLFFCDIGKSIVDSITLDGGNRMHHVDTSGIEFQAIALDADYMYLTAQYESNILRVRKNADRATDLVKLASTGSKLMKDLILIGSSYQQQGHSACSVNNGDCSHFCLPVPEGRVCACPDCQNGLTCAKPQNPHNGTVVPNGHRMTCGSVVHYYCNAGYTLVGSPTGCCTEYGWSKTPVCNVIECPPPDAPANGNVTYSGEKIGDKASYTCGKGYILQGPIFRHCQLHGQWSQSMPQCIVIECPTPDAPAKGNVTHSGKKDTTKKRHSLYFTW